MQSPSNLTKVLQCSNPDSHIWRSAYNKEYDGLDDMNVFDLISEDEYQKLVTKHGNDARAISSMNLFTVKKDKKENLVGGKSQIVVLGNLERRIWSQEDKYAPVLSSISTRLLVSMACQDGPTLESGDCKNAFCNGILPDNEICIVKPPKGYPRTPEGCYWKLN